MAIDALHPDLLNELTLGSVQTQPLDPSMQQLPETVGQLGGSAPPSLQQPPAAPSPATHRPTFMSAFLANLGPALAGGIQAGAKAPTVGAGLVAGIGGGISGQIEQQHYQQQLGLQAEELKARTEYQQAQAESLRPSIPMQTADGNTVMIPPAHIATAYAQGLRFAATTQAAGTRAGAQLGVQSMKSATEEKVTGAKIASTEKVAGEKITAEEAIAKMRLDAAQRYRDVNHQLQEDKFNWQKEWAQGKPSEAARGRADAAIAQNKMIERANLMLQDPTLLAQLGPLPGRVADAERVIGNQSPEVQRFYGTIKSIYSLAGTTHGWRALQVAQEFEKAYGGLKTNPEAFKAGLQALHDAGGYIKSVITKNQWMPAGTSTTPSQPPAATGGDFFQQFGGKKH